MTSNTPTFDERLEAIILQIGAKAIADVAGTLEGIFEVVVSIMLPPPSRPSLRSRGQTHSDKPTKEVIDDNDRNLRR